jgi:predicted metal-dependent hydrolase
VNGSNGHPRTLRVQFGRKQIEYRLGYSPRKTLGIDVHPDLSVVVTAPNGSTDEAVEQRVKKRAAWIVQQQRFFETYLPTLPPRRYVSGESHRYLGRQYRLRVHQADADGVKMARGQINVGLTDTSKKERVRSLVTAWFRRRAEAVFGEVFAGCSVQAERQKIQPSGFQIRKMTNRWGSCTAEGHILLNPDLIVAPLPCIEYVVVHELCHLREHNHGTGFYRLLTAMMPDWERRRERLNLCVASE